MVRSNKYVTNNTRLLNFLLQTNILDNIKQ